MTSKPIPLRLWERGYRALVSVIPPGASISPGSRIPASQLGKVPGVRNANGTWRGYGWLKHNPTEADVRDWIQNGANIGLLAAHFPCCDVDSKDPVIAAECERIAKDVLGPAPVRVGLPPKRLLVYRTSEPFSRMAAIIHLNGVDHLVEVFGQGRQYLVGGQHPSGRQYQWDTPLHEIEPGALTEITRDKALSYFAQLAEYFEMLGADVTLVGDGQVRDRNAGPQADLLAPNITALRECVALIPNTDELFPTRDDYIKIGYAIRAAAGDDEEEGYEAFAEWAGRHVADGRVAGNPETWRNDWRRMRPPYSVGWTWLAELATAYGFNTAQHEFRADPVAHIQEREEAPPRMSDLWLAHQVVEEHGGALRHVPATDRWHVWSGGRWEPDAVLLADHLVSRTLKRLAVAIVRQGANDRERAANLRTAVELCSASRQRNVRLKLRSDPRITCAPTAFDADPHILNTPAGIVDLRTGEMRPHDPDALCSRRTLVAPDFELPAPRWEQFLLEACGGDIQLVAYLRRLCGYGATGLTREQMLAFLWGPGGNGKSVFLNAVSEVLGDYVERAAMDTFAASNYDRHPTDLAALAGARLVTAVETQGGRRWDEQRVKALTGGDSVRARFMRQDFFSYVPQFLLMFAGNHRPEIRDLDPAMRRRIHLVPFVQTPVVPDTGLADALKPEYPAILAWVIMGAIEWYRRALLAPESVIEATSEYLASEDSTQAWLDERCELGAAFTSTTAELLRSWSEWARERGEQPGSAKRLAQALITKGFQRWKEVGTRQRGFKGLRARDPLEDVL